MVDGKQVVTQEFIVKDPSIAGGAPTIKGTRIRVSDIVIEFEYWGKTPDDIIRAHPHLSLAQVHAALAYYYEHVAEIKAEISSNETIVSELKQKLSH
ncbi:MAG TPA: DUF433 domain-containing protein [Candidatus Nanoarchaeia archaeon]|nr:DUF433 domain-containing protein [Candidatus Nanoarchaeia archaeon]